MDFFIKRWQAIPWLHEIHFEVIRRALSNEILERIQATKSDFWGRIHRDGTENVR